MADRRSVLADHYLSARSRGWDYRGSLHYAIDRTNNDLIRSFK